MYQTDETSWAHRSKKYKRKYLSAVNQLYGEQGNEAVDGSRKEKETRRAGRADQVGGVAEETGHTSPGKR